MRIRAAFTEWMGRQVRGLGSLLSAIVLVVGVLLFALFSLGVSSGALPSGDDEIMTRAEGAFELAQGTLPALYIEPFADRPIALTAQIETHGWKDRGQRIIDANISAIEPLASPTEVGKAPKAYPEGQITAQLKGKRILASVTQAAAEVLPASGAAKVAMIVTPSGETATVVIDQVLSPVRSAASEAGASDAQTADALATAGVAGSGPSVAAVSSARVTSLSRYWGAPGTLVTMNGSGFGNSAGANWVTCAGAKAKVKSWSDTRIEFWVPSAMTKQGYVGVNKNKVNSNGMYFSPFNPPVITLVNPREGAQGTVVTISGKYFGSRQADGWVSFAGSTAQVVSWADTSIRVIVPKDAASGYVGVVAHGMTSNGVLYGPLGAPFVQSASTKVLIPGRTVTIRGRSFGVRRGSVVVRRPVGTSPSPVTVSFWSATEIRFTVPADAANGYVGVVRADAMTSNGIWMAAAPRVDSLSRWWAPPSGDVTIRGVGFGSTQGARSVFIGGKEAVATSWSDTQVTFKVPASATSGYVGVGTRSACSNGIWLTVETQAYIAEVTPRLVSAGDRITITGAEFGPGPATAPQSKVTIGGAGCEIESWSNDSIVAIVPDGISLSYVGVVKQRVASNGVWVIPKSGN